MPESLRLLSFPSLLYPGAFRGGLFAAFRVTLNPQDLRNHVKRPRIFRQEARRFPQRLERSLHVSFLLQS